MRKAFALIAPVAFGLAAASSSAPVLAQDAATEEGVEAVFVQCVFDKDPELARAIQDAPSQEAFIEALEKATLLCDQQVDGMSLGRMFTRLNELLPSDDDSLDKESGT